MKLRYTPETFSDLEQIETYISEKLFIPGAAKGSISSIAQSAKQLKKEPYVPLPGGFGTFTR